MLRPWKLYLFTPKKKGDIHLQCLQNHPQSLPVALAIPRISWPYSPESISLTNPRGHPIASSWYMTLTPRSLTLRPWKVTGPQGRKGSSFKKNIVFQGRTVKLWVCIQWTQCAPSNPFHQGCVLSSPSTWQCPARLQLDSFRFLQMGQATNNSPLGIIDKKPSGTPPGAWRSLLTNYLNLRQISPWIKKSWIQSRINK